MQIGHRNIWLNEQSHWFSWVLSVESARKHYSELVLITDRDGARVLVDEIGLPFTEVTTELDALDDADCGWWAIGKLHAYRAQRRPFVHIDSDVFLWQRLPAILEYAPVFAQSPELLSDYDIYEPARIHRLLQSHDGSIPPEFTWYLSRAFQVAACCGILGGNDVEFIRYYAGLAIDVALNPRNRSAWMQEGDIGRHIPLIEQYLLCACVEYQQVQPVPVYPGVRIEYMFPNASFERAAEVGYTHLLSDAKRHRDVIERLERVVRRDYPEYYSRCMEVSRRGRRPAPRIDHDDAGQGRHEGR
jgi:hypothetical protein